MKKWIGKLKNKKIVDEDSCSWNEVKADLASLSFVTEGNDRHFELRLPDNMEYIQGKTASAFIGGGTTQIESRYIGFRLGNNTIKIRVNEKTHNINIEVE